MTWIRFGQVALLEKGVSMTLLCAQVSLLGVLAVAILPFISEVLELRTYQKHSRRKNTAYVPNRER